MAITPENEREMMRIDERDSVEAEHAAILAALLLSQMDALLPARATDAEIQAAAGRVSATADDIEAALVALLLASVAIGIDAGSAQIGAVGLAVDEAAATDDAQQGGRDRARVALAAILATTERGIMSAVSEWIAQTGRDVEALRDELSYLFSRARAENIAQTEGAFGFNRGVMAVATSVGATQMRWYTMQDERVCPICRPMHGKRREMTGSYPGGAAPPPAHPRCRCGEEIVIRGIGNG